MEGNCTSFLYCVSVCVFVCERVCLGVGSGGGHTYVCLCVCVHASARLPVFVCLSVRVTVPPF